MAKQNKRGSLSMANFKKLENNCKNWLLTNPIPVTLEAMVIGAYGAAASVVFETIAIKICSVFPVPPPMKVVAGSRLMNAREIGVLVGVNAGIRCAMKKIRGKDDVQNSMVAGFGGVVAFTMIRREHPAIAVSFGILAALASGGLFKVLAKVKESH